MTSPARAKTFSVIERWTLVADDGYRLATTRYSAQGQLKGNLIMAGATGVQPVCNSASIAASPSMPAPRASMC